MIKKSDIDSGIKFFNIDNKYKEKCYECADFLNADSRFLKSFQDVYDFLNYGNINNLKKIWEIEDISDLFIKEIPPFATNLMVVLGYEKCRENMDKAQLDTKIADTHIKRIKTIFENDADIALHGGILFTQMSWAYYFIRMRIIEAGRLQYENFDGKLIKIHIPSSVPSGEKLTVEAVRKSYLESKALTENVFGFFDPDYLCESWLLSKQVVSDFDKETNLYKFYSLFDVSEGEDCLKDVLHYVFPGMEKENYKNLPEKTTLQKVVKEKLINGTTFKLGMGKLIKEKIINNN
ncbi:MAG: hypothetical protein IJD91_03345 [Clostridia bacterium]|nr:hypothetical protein [Clostridia bacterium]